VAAACVVTAAAGSLAATQANRVAPADAALAALISRADLHYTAPAPRPEEGMPLGNGRTGTLVWTTPSALRFQVNRADVYPSGSGSTSFPERNSEYGSGVGFADVVLGGPALSGRAFDQRLGIYDGLMEVRGAGVVARLLAWHARDVIAIEVDDRRRQPEPITVKLRMLRFGAQPLDGDLETRTGAHIVAVRRFEHVAASQLHVRGETIGLTQEFVEREHFNKTALVAAVAGRTARPEIANESEVQLVAPAARGRFVVLLGSASTFDVKEDVLASAARSVEAARGPGFAGLRGENERWWHAFWDRGFVDLSSANGDADYVEAGYHYFLYLMASSSRGRFPPKFNGMLWNTGGDMRAWGTQHWFANLSCYYEAIPAANRLELLDPVFDMYGGAYESWSRAAREQWGSQGIFIPETAFFDGLAPLPPDIASEMRDLYLLRKPWSERSARFTEYAAARLAFSSRWNWIRGGRWTEARWTVEDRGAGPFGAVTHILGTTAKVAYLFWRRYEYTLDREFLRARAYPMIKGAAEFYRNFPNLRRGDDGRYHIHHVNSNESVYGARDTDEDLSAMRGILPAAIRAAEILNVDADLRASWRELLANLAPLPTSDDPEALRGADYRGPRVLVRGLEPAVRGEGVGSDVNSLPSWFFDLCNLESDDPARLDLCRATFDTTMVPRGTGPTTSVGVLSKIGIAAATLGRADAVRHLIPNQMRILGAERPGAYKKGGLLANRLSLREGHHALDAQFLGRASEALHMALLQSNPPSPGKEPVLRLFPAWPMDWDASFKLAARGAFIVRASVKAGEVGRVTIHSQAGAWCRLRNPWGPGSAVTLRTNGAAAETIHGDLLELPTVAGDTLVLERAGAPGASGGRSRR
jgi:hypothetical protein